MDFATLIGLILGSIVVAVAVLLGSGFAPFVNLPGLLIVIGGAFSATLIRFPLKACLRSFVTALKQAFKEEVDSPLELIELAQHLANVARKKGLIALEDEAVNNELFAKGVQLCVDGHDTDLVRSILRNEIHASIRRNEVGERVFRALGDAAPAFGMIGTLVGLVQMLITLSDPSSIGPAMAVALLTTLYGALLANLLFLPIADKLRTRAEEERSNKTLIVEGVLGIQQGTNPRVLRELLETHLPMDQRELAGADDATGDAEAKAA